MLRIRAILASAVPVAAIAAFGIPLARAQSPIVPAPPYYAMNPAQPLTPSANNPLQQQILEDYRSQLLQTQREQMQLNPSGAAAAQLQVGRQLNGFGPGYDRSSPPAPAISAPAPSTMFNLAPLSSSDAPPLDTPGPPAYPATPQ
jgi:hypothetical protein